METLSTLSTIPTVTHVIQQALTPVFLLGVVSAILNVFTGRLARIIDRQRFLSETDHEQAQRYQDELMTLPRRIRLIYWAISLCTLSALLVCIAIVTLFVGAELGVNLSSIISILFIAIMLILTIGLFCFFREISLATSSAINSIENLN